MDFSSIANTVTTLVDDGSKIYTSVNNAVHSLKSGTPAQTVPVDTTTQASTPGAAGAMSVFEKYGLYIAIGVIGFILILVFRKKIK